MILIRFVFRVFVVVFQARSPYQVGKNNKEMGVPGVGVSEEGVCCKIRLPVKFKDPKFKYEIFMRIIHTLLKLFH